MSGKRKRKSETEDATGSLVTDHEKLNEFWTGRDQEVLYLQAFLRQKRIPLALVHGTTGVGKTRLVAQTLNEFASRMNELHLNSAESPGKVLVTYVDCRWHRSESSLSNALASQIASLSSETSRNLVCRSACDLSVLLESVPEKSHLVIVLDGAEENCIGAILDLLNSFSSESHFKGKFLQTVLIGERPFSNLCGISIEGRAPLDAFLSIHVAPYTVEDLVKIIVGHYDHTYPESFALRSLFVAVAQLVVETVSLASLDVRELGRATTRVFNSVSQMEAQGMQNERTENRLDMRALFAKITPILKDTMNTVFRRSVSDAKRKRHLAEHLKLFELAVYLDRDASRKMICGALQKRKRHLEEHLKLFELAAYLGSRCVAKDDLRRFAISRRNPRGRKGVPLKSRTDAQVSSAKISLERLLAIYDNLRERRHGQLVLDDTLLYQPKPKTDQMDRLAAYARPRCSSAEFARMWSLKRVVLVSSEQQTNPFVCSNMSHAEAKELAEELGLSEDLIELS
eukprot:CAMPEP_0182451646 /NCGR_PEP_ID=MMETSP1172-20130603/43827_1 /TAXON_ID=708627 /ORGANISM="Timspurckia oligopyrenoides, Strain CCMP3278" /LENGTH=512 /DNA_ID=CAMNT_0024649431 /DNA_START=173 /DNA_END=1712 /DNA_ORIENTATION=-